MLIKDEIEKYGGSAKMHGDKWDEMLKGCLEDLHKMQINDRATDASAASMAEPRWRK